MYLSTCSAIYTQKIEQVRIRQSTEKLLQSTHTKLSRVVYRIYRKKFAIYRKKFEQGCSYQAVRFLSFLRHPWHLEVPTSPWSPGSCTPIISKLQTSFKSEVFNDFKLVASDIQDYHAAPFPLTLDKEIALSQKCWLSWVNTPDFMGPTSSVYSCSSCIVL